MKKFLCVTTILVLSLSFVACGNKSTTTANNTTNNTTKKATTKATTKAPITAKATTTSANAINATTSDPAKAKITYTKELKYIPSYTGVKLDKYTASTKKAPFATAKYTIKNTTNTKVYQDYQTILKKDGWTITQSKKYFSLSAKKGTHIANCIIQTSGKDVVLMIISK